MVSRLPLSPTSKSLNDKEMSGRLSEKIVSPTVSHSLHCIKLTPEQEAARSGIVEFATAERRAAAVATLSGYAGVGKTTVVAEVVKAVAGQRRLVVAAPTHKALAVLRAKLAGIDDVEFATIHSLLGLRLQETEDGLHRASQEGEPSLFEYAFAVVDECSMISDAMFAMILSHRGSCRVLFVGDPAQLPPVDAKPGAQSPTFGPIVRDRWELMEVVRQARNNPIIRIATAARERITIGQPFVMLDIAQQLRPEDAAFMAMYDGGPEYAAWLTADAIRLGLETRALAYDNQTVVQINARVQAMLHPMERSPWIPGNPVMAQSQFRLANHGGEMIPVQNSEILTVEKVDTGNHPLDPDRAAWILTLKTGGNRFGTCYVPLDERALQRDISEAFNEHRAAKVAAAAATHSARAGAMRELASAASARGWALKNRYAPLRLAYAMTVHKSQGSTFDATVICWGSFSRCRDFGQRNRLAYVALTRTAKFTALVAD